MSNLLNIDITPIATFKWTEENGLKLRERREASGHSRKTLAEQVGISQTYIHQLESPQTFLNKPKKPTEMTASAEILQKICAVIGGDVISLVWDVECDTLQK